MQKIVFRDELCSTNRRRKLFLLVAQLLQILKHHTVKWLKKHSTLSVLRTSLARPGISIHLLSATDEWQLFYHFGVHLGSAVPAFCEHAGAALQSSDFVQYSCIDSCS